MTNWANFTAVCIARNISLKSDCYFAENPAEPAKSEGLLWRMGSGMYNITKGTVGMGVGAVKFVANTGYTAVSKVNLIIFSKTF